MSANGIAHLATREARQKAKLDLAASNREARSGNRDTEVTADDRYTYDLTELPTVYSGNSISDNANADGLIVGRPWTTGPTWELPAGMNIHEPLEGSGGGNNTVPGTTYLTAASSGINASYGIRGTPFDPGGNVSSVSNSATGIYREKYIGNLWSTYGAYSEFNITWFDNPTRGPIGTEVYSYAGFGMRSDLTAENNYTLMWRGYVQAPATGTFNMWTAGTDDDAAFWIGTAAINPTYANMNAHASGNRVTSINSFTLTAGQWYPVRMVFTEFGGWEQCQWFLQDSTHAHLYGGTDLTWAYNTVTKGY